MVCQDSDEQPVLWQGNIFSQTFSALMCESNDGKKIPRDITDSYQYGDGEKKHSGITTWT